MSNVVVLVSYLSDVFIGYGDSLSSCSRIEAKKEQG